MAPRGDPQTLWPGIWSGTNRNLFNPLPYLPPCVTSQTIQSLPSPLPARKFCLPLVFMLEDVAVLYCRLPTSGQTLLELKMLLWELSLGHSSLTKRAGQRLCQSRDCCIQSTFVHSRSPPSDDPSAVQHLYLRYLTGNLLLTVTYYALCFADTILVWNFTGRWVCWMLVCLSKNWKKDSWISRNERRPWMPTVSQLAGIKLTTFIHTRFSVGPDLVSRHFSQELFQ